MPIETFSRPSIWGTSTNADFQQPSPAALAAGLRGSTAEPKLIQQGVTPTAAASPELMENSPFRSAYSQGLIDKALKGDNRNPWDLAGNVAMLASGYYLKSKDDDKQKSRDKALGDYIRTHLPDMEPLWNVADAEQRKEIEKQARSTMLARAEEVRKRTQSNEDLSGVREALKNGNWEAARTAALDSKSPEVSGAALQSGLDDLKESARNKAHDLRAAQQRQLQYEEKYRQAKAAGLPEDQARAHAAGVNIEVLGSASAQDDPYASPYELARDKTERALLLKGSQDESKDNVKKYRDQVSAAQLQARTLNVVEGIVNNPSVYQGIGHNRIHQLKQIGTAMGLKVDGVGEEDLMTSIANDLAKGARAGYPGAVSNFEYQTYLKSVVSGLNTREGNLAIISYLRQSAALQTAVSEDIAAWRKMKRERNPNSPALLDGSFNTWHEERQAARIEKLAELKAAADEAVRAGGAITREQRLQSQRSDPTPGASAPSPSSTGETVVEHGGKKYRRVGTGQFQEIE